MDERGECDIMQGTSHGDGGDLRTLLGKHGPRIQAIAAIIPGTGQHGDAGILHGKTLVVKQLHRHPCRGGSGHTHQRHAIVQQRTLHIAHGIGIIGAVQQHLQAVGIIGGVHWNPFPDKTNTGTTVVRGHADMRGGGGIRLDTRRPRHAVDSHTADAAWQARSDRTRHGNKKTRAATPENRRCRTGRSERTAARRRSYPVGSGKPPRERAVPPTSRDHSPQTSFAMDCTSAILAHC